MGLTCALIPLKRIGFFIEPLGTSLFYFLFLDFIYFWELTLKFYNITDVCFRTDSLEKNPNTKFVKGIKHILGIITVCFNTFYVLDLFVSHKTFSARLICGLVWTQSWLKMHLRIDNIEIGLIGLLQFVFKQSFLFLDF